MPIFGKGFGVNTVSQLTETAIAKAVAASGLTQAQAQQALAAAPSLATGLRVIGVTVVADATVPAPVFTTSNTPSNLHILATSVTGASAAFAGVQTIIDGYTSRLTVLGV